MIALIRPERGFMSAADAVDVAWLLIAAALVMLMQAGFSSLESGLVRTKNSINVAAKNFADFLLSSAVFWLFAFALMFGATAGGLVGASDFMFEGRGDPWLVAFFLFQLGFVGTSVTIVSGAVAERMRFSSYLIVAGLVSALVYPVFGHWAWSSAAGLGGLGWLEQIGFIDFAGSTVVHSIGGWSALAAILVIGPRIGRFGPNSVPIHGHDLPLVTLGVFILWFGWFGFNGGSTLGLTADVPSIIMNTSISAAFGGLVALGLTWWRDRHPDVPTIMNGALAGLVGITASANIVAPVQAVAIGCIAGAVMYAAALLLERLHVDDAVGAVPVHLAAGIWGTLAVALFGSVEAFSPGVGRFEQLVIQVAGVATAGIWAFGLVYAILRLIRRFHRLRVDPDGERQGLNIAEHGASTEIVDLLQEMDGQRVSGDYSQPVKVEPHTEVGQIARQYNRVLAAINEESRNREAAVVALQQKTSSLELLQTISRAVNEEPDLETAYRIALEKVCAFAGWPAGHVYAVSTDGSTLTPTRIWHLDDADRFSELVRLTNTTSFGAGEGLPGVAAQTMKPVRLDLPTSDTRFPRAAGLELSGIKTGFAFPVLAGRQTAAVLEFFSDEPNAQVDEQLLDLMASVGTQLGRAVERRRTDETRFRTVVDHLPAMVLLRDLEGRFLLVNRRYEDFYRVANEAIQGRTMRELERDLGVHLQADLSKAHDRQAIEENRAVEHEIEVDLDGRTVVLASVKFPIPDASGQAVALGGIELDITDRKHQEADLAEARDEALKAGEALQSALGALEGEHERSEGLLLNVLPSSIASRLKAGERTIADHFSSASILFADIVDFTPYSVARSPEAVVDALDEIFSAFDALADERGLEKIKTIGDAYMVAAGIPEARADHVEAIVDMAIAMMRAAHDPDTQGGALDLRIGIDTGPVVAGVIGRRKFIYDLWGDTVNTASRMESHGVPGRIQVTSRVRDAVDSRYEFQARGPIEVKGKGLVDTWLLRTA